jgi:hypothetical protein
MRNGLPCELQIAICKMSYAANMVCPINELADLPKMISIAVYPPDWKVVYLDHG